MQPKAELRLGKYSFMKHWGDWTQIPVPPLCLLWPGSWIRREKKKTSAVYSALYFQRFPILAPACRFCWQASERIFAFFSVSSSRFLTSRMSHSENMKWFPSNVFFFLNSASLSAMSILHSRQIFRFLRRFSWTQPNLFYDMLIH